MTEFLGRLKRRKLVQWAVAYVAFAFALLQGAEVIAQQFGWPDGLRRGITLVLALGFLVVLVLAWYHGERGEQRVSSAEIVILALLLAIGGGLLWRFARESNAAGNASIATATARDSTTARSPHTAQLNSGVASLAPAAAAISAKSVAVLPLANESGEKDQQYFSDGLSEDLITALSQFAGLKVINRDSSFRFRNSQDDIKTIAAKLGVAHLLEGSVQRLGDQVRISAELVNASDGSTLWSQHYDRPYKDLFALQDDITKAVAGALKAKLLDGGSAAVVKSDKPPSGSLAAYNAYLQGRFYAHRETEADLRKAIAHLADATRLDPGYALAWAVLGNAQSMLAGNFLGGAESAQTWGRARSAVHTALSLDPNLAAAHESHAFILSSVDHDWARAETEAQRAYQLDPDKAFFALAVAQGTLGHAQQAVELLRHGLQTDPLCEACYDYLARYLPALGRFDEAEQAAGKALQLSPEFHFSRVQLTYVYAMQGNATATLQAAQQQPPGQWRDLASAMALQIGGNRTATDTELQKVVHQQAGYAAYQIAEIYALRRDPDNMFKWLERASENHDPGITLLLTDPPVLRYRNDPRFAAFCRKVGLPITTGAKALP